MSKKKKSTSYKDSAAYKALSPDEQNLADLYQGVTDKSVGASSKDLKNALKKAKKDSSPYMTQILREFETKVSSDVAAETNDWQSHLNTVNENIKEINQELTQNSASLTLTEQQDLAKQARDFEQQKGTLIQGLANTGTNFSTIGENAKAYAEKTNQGIVESTTATYDANLQSLKQKAAEGNAQAQLELTNYNQKHQANVNTIGLGAETYLGSTMLGNQPIAGYNPMGKISGGYKEDVVKDISSRADAYLGQSQMKSLNFSGV